MWPFKCKHPGKALQVYSEQSMVKKYDGTKYPYDVVTTHLWCKNCQTRFDIKHSDITGWDDLLEEK